MTSVKHGVAGKRQLPGRFLLVAGIVLVALNLRPALTSVGPLISSIRDDLSISSGVAGLLTTLPLLAFAALSSVAPRISRRTGNETAILAGLVVLLIGLLARSSGWVPGLFIGTVLVGAGIAICNVLLPSVIKSRFPEKIGLMTSVYTTCMGVCATFASGISVPLAQGLGWGWQWALACWAVLTVVAIAAWFPHARQRSGQAGQVRSMAGAVWRSPLAWQLTLFMGMQSFLFYSLVTWLPEIVHSHGMSMSAAGGMLAFVQLVGLPSTFFTPVLADRFADQRGIVVGIGVLYFAGVAGLVVGGSTPLIMFWCLLLGLGQGASISLSLTLISLRANDAQQTSELSGMAQSFGYLLAAAGPVAAGMLFDGSGGWTVPLVSMLVITVVMLFVGLGAGRNQKVGSEPARV